MQRILSFKIDVSRFHWWVSLLSKYVVIGVELGLYTDAELFVLFVSCSSCRCIGFINRCRGMCTLAWRYASDNALHDLSLAC